MKLGIIINTKDPEKVWNALRLGNAALKNNNITNIFFLGEGVEAEDCKSKKFNVKEQIKIFVENRGLIKSCGTCLVSRKKKASKVCPSSNLGELLALIEKSDKMLTFG